MPINRYIDDLVTQIGKINPSTINQWEILPLDSLKFTKPTVLCFSGNGAVTNKQANKLAQQAAAYLGLMFKTKDGNHTLDNVDIMGIKYAISNITGSGIIDETALNQLSNAILALLVDKDGNKLDLATAKKNMSRLTFFTYCAGNHELQATIHNLNKKMTMIGYDYTEIKAINRATLEVCFAPLNYPLNRIPCVRVFSMSDSLMNKFLYDGLGSVTEKQLDLLDGVHIHQTQSDTINAAASIEVLSSGLINSHNGKLNEHAVTIMGRNYDWSLRTTFIDGKAYQAPNADCVSQIMAWALCKGVENSVQNFQAQEYVPNTYWHELAGDFKSIINSFGQEKLARNPNLMYKKRKLQFNCQRMKKLFKFFPRFALPHYDEMVDKLNNADSWEDAVNYLKKNQFLGVEHVLPEVQVLTNPEKAAILKMAGKNDEAHIQELGIEI